MVLKFFFFFFLKGFLFFIFLFFFGFKIRCQIGYKQHNFINNIRDISKKKLVHLNYYLFIDD